jgi:alanyl-tRNA synthetase
MGETGPCGTSSEIFIDKGEAYGEEGGPAYGNPERYMEFWNLVFMDSLRQPDQSVVPLTKRNIDTGASVVRCLIAVNDLSSVWETDILVPLVDAAQSATSYRTGTDPRGDVSLRILADHATTVTFLVNDGVTPSNEERGYVVRRLLRRAVRHAHQLGVERPVLAPLVAAVVDLYGDWYPDLRRNADYVTGILSREEERFRQTLRSGGAILDEALENVTRVDGELAFLLHDTYGYPIDLTKEIAAERGVEVDDAGFQTAMAAQRERAKRDRQLKRQSGSNEVSADEYKQILDRFGPTEFTGYDHFSSHGEVLAVLDVGEIDGVARLELFLDRTPFYAEGGGQIGDTGTIVTSTGEARVVDTTSALPGLTRHVVEMLTGAIEPGQEATASIDVARRQAIRRNHTGTHLLHAALREVLGSEVHQQGSYVGPDYLRFDFNYHSALASGQVRAVEDLVNSRVLADEPVVATEMPRTEAEALGAMAFFGEKYGEVVRVIQAGSHSTELCGGTHASATGFIGPMKIMSERSIATGTRRIEAVTGFGTIDVMRTEEDALSRAASVLRAGRPEDVVEAAERIVARAKALEDELRVLQGGEARSRAAALATSAVDGAVVARVDGIDAAGLKDLAVAVRDHPDVSVVVLAGSPDGARVAMVSAVRNGSALPAGELIADAARLVGGGAGRQADIATAGGKSPADIDAALEHVRGLLAH